MICAKDTWKNNCKKTSARCRKLFQILRIKMHYRSIKRTCCRSKHAATIVGSLLSWSFSRFFCSSIALYSCLWLSNCCHSSAVSPAADFSLDSNYTHTLRLSFDGCWKPILNSRVSIYMYNNTRWFHLAGAPVDNIILSLPYDFKIYESPHAPAQPNMCTVQLG